MSIYKDKGYINREDYLETMADDYGVDNEVIYCLADLLGEDEDFDGLVCALEDYEMFEGWW